MARPAFIDKQYEFTAHIRNPDVHPRPEDVEPRRMQVYNELFYNNVEDFMSSSYPVLRQILGDDRWHALVRDYFHRHKAKTPLFPEMPREFLIYLQHEYEASEHDYPFMLELAHYEWAELALSIADQETDDSNIDTKGDLLAGLPALSPLAWPLVYQWPVHKIGPDFLPHDMPAAITYLLLYRDNEDEIHFMELNPVTARLVQMIQEQTHPNATTMLQQIAQELNHPDPQTVLAGGLTILQDLVQRRVIVGMRKD